MNRGRAGLGGNQGVIPLPTVAGILAVTALAVVAVIALVGVAIRRPAKAVNTATPGARAGLVTLSDLGSGWRAWDQALPATTATTSLPDATENSLATGINQCLNGDGFPAGSRSRASAHFVRDAGPKTDLFTSVDQWASPGQAGVAFGAFNVGALNACFTTAGEQAANQHIKDWGWPSLRGGETFVQVLPKPNVGLRSVAGRSVITMQFLVSTTAHVYVDVVGIQQSRFTTSMAIVSSFVPLSDESEYAIEQAANNRMLALGA